MNNFSLIGQVMMIGVAIGIAVIYINPKVTSIRETQDIIANYKTETQNVSAVNEALKSKVALADSIRPQDTQALQSFLPDAVDEITVMKDISNIIDTANISDFDVSYTGVSGDTSDEADTESQGGESATPASLQSLSKHNFTISFDTSYNQLKSFLSLLETNHYILQVDKLNAVADERGTLKVSMNVSTFDRSIASEAQTE
jgi:hypothetical protein